MASANVDLSDYRKFAPPYDEPPRQRGCFFYGCIIAGILSLLLVIAVGIMFFFVYRWFEGMVEQYTATEPRALPKVEIPAERRRTLTERFDAFRAAVDAGNPAEPLVLDGQDINALIEERTPFKDKVFVTIAGDRLKGEVSIPLSDILRLGLTRGRFLNGEAEFNVWLKDGALFVTISSFEVNGKRPSEEILRQLRGQNLAKEANEDPRKAEEIGKLQSIEVKDGRLIIKARGRSNAPEAGQSEGTPRIEDRDGKASVHPPDRPAPDGGTSTPSRTLPDDVLAPPESRPAPPAESAKIHRP